MEKRTLRIIFTKSGSGSISPKINIPMKWIRELGITEDDREVILEFDKDRIILIKK
jgi:hypothetical protein